MCALKKQEKDGCVMSVFFVSLLTLKEIKINWKSLPEYFNFFLLRKNLRLRKATNYTN